MAPRKPPVIPTESVEPVVPTEGEFTVKHKTNGKTFKVSQAYYQANKHKLDVA